MNKTNINYPHPVLSSANEDYIQSSFDISLVDEPSIEENNVVINVAYSLLCDGLQYLIASGDAQVVIYMNSTVAEYRQMKAFDSDKTEMNIKINRNDINKSLQLKGYIIAANSIKSFSLPEHNKAFFGTVPFSLRKGDIMGLATHSFNIPLESYDPLADRPSIFSIRKQTQHPKEEVSSDFSGQKITIWLNEETHNKYRTLYAAPDTRGVLSAFFAAPVLVDTLYFMKNMTEEEKIEYESKKWYQVINHRLQELKLDISSDVSMTKIANLILPRIFSSSVEALTQLCEALLKGGEKDEN
ncbi:MAG: hypothetical protein KBS62_05145 [Oscillospiraceae bacterium]|nr:hypothetical protein [Candidatus Ruminococcus equi]